jgi:RNA polymerase sigma-70 factor (ECF subfamily)
VALNRAVALAEVAGPGPALTVVDNLALERYHLFHASRADLLDRLGRPGAAVAAYDAALALTQNTAERDLLCSKRRAAAQAATGSGSPEV